MGERRTGRERRRSPRSIRLKAQAGKRGRHREPLPSPRPIPWGTSGRVSGNIATSFTIPETVEGSNNLTAQARGNGATPLKKIFLNPPKGSDPPLEAFVVNPNSPAGKAGQGARMICGAELPAAP